MNRLSAERRTQIIAALCEGASVNATARQTGASKVTILKLLAEIGSVCLDYQRSVMVNLTCRLIQCDEIWGFIQCKQSKLPRDERGRGRGDVWVWVAMDPVCKLILAVDVGERTLAMAQRLVHQVPRCWRRTAPRCFSPMDSGSISLRLSPIPRSRSQVEPHDFLDFPEITVPWPQKAPGATVYRHAYGNFGCQVCIAVHPYRALARCGERTCAAGHQVDDWQRMQA